MADGKNGQRKKWPKNKKETYLHAWLFSVKYPAEHALKLKGYNSFFYTQCSIY